LFNVSHCFGLLVGHICLRRGTVPCGATRLLAAKYIPLQIIFVNAASHASPRRGKLLIWRIGCASEAPDRLPEDPGRDVPGDLASVGLEAERACRSGIGTAAPCICLRPQADWLRLHESGQLHTAPDRPPGEPGALYKYRTTRLGGHLLGGVEEPPVVEQRDV